MDSYPTATQPAGSALSEEDASARRTIKASSRDAMALKYAAPPMGLSYNVVHRDRHSIVRAEGEPTLGEFLAFLQDLADESAGWANKRLLVDLRGVRSLTTPTEHYAVGEAAARLLKHMHRVASVVPPDRITRASEKTAQRSGLNLVVFTDEGAALAWLLA